MKKTKITAYTIRNVLIIALVTGMFGLLLGQSLIDIDPVESAVVPEPSSSAATTIPGGAVDFDLLDYAALNRMRNPDFLYGQPTVETTPEPTDQTPATQETLPKEPTETTSPPGPVFLDVNYVVYISANHLNLRSEPSLDAEILLVLRAGDKATCEGENDQWLRIHYDGQLGYVKAEYTSTSMTFKAADEYVYVKANTLNLRKGPSLDADIASKLCRNQAVRRIGIGDQWSKVETLSGAKGYVYSQYLVVLPEYTQKAYHSDADYSSVTQEEIDLFRKIVALEGHPKYGYEGYLSVATIILNRVESSRFPNTITGVVSQPNQFSVYTSPRVPVYNNDINKAVEDALAGKRNLPDYVLAFITTAAYTPNVQNMGAFWRLPVYGVWFGTVWCYFGQTR